MALLLQDLPIELLDSVLRYLPLSDLLSFARTSKSNYELSIRALATLDLAVFPRQIHSLLAFFDASNSEEDEREDEDGGEDPPISTCWTRRAASDRTLRQIGLTTPKPSRPSLSRSITPPSVGTFTHGSQCSVPLPTRSPSSRPTPLALRTAEITAQNTVATDVLETPSLRHLRSLTIRLYDLNSVQLARTIATSFPHLQHLGLEFSHPYIHDTTLPAKFWSETVPGGSPLWNVFAGVGQEHAAVLKLKSLRSLRLTRSGITTYQLRHWIAANPQLRELRLGLCRGVDSEFLVWLAQYCVSSVLETVHLVDCSLLDLRSEKAFAAVQSLLRSGSIRDFSVRGCSSVDDDLFVRIGTEVMDVESGPVRLVSPKGVVLHRRALSGDDSDAFAMSVHRKQARSVSPMLTGGESSDYFGKLEVDPRLEI